MCAMYIHIHVTIVLGDLCDNIGLVGVSAKWSYVTASPSHHDQAIPILSPLLFMHVGHPYIPLFKIQRIFDLLVSPPFLLFIQRGSNPSIDVYAHIFIILTHYPIPFSTLISQLYYSITMRFATKKVPIWPVSSMYIHVHVLLPRIDLQ